MPRTLIAPDGSRGTVDESEVDEAIANGYVVADEGGGGLPGWVGPAAAGTAALGVTGLAASRIPAVTRQLSRESGVLGQLARGTRAALGRTPRAPDVAAAAPPEATAAGPPGSSSARGKLQLVESGLPKGYTTVSARDLKEHPEALKAFKKGDPIQIKEITKLRMQKGQGGGPTRPIMMEGKPAKAPANKPPNGPGVGRGKSGPKLAREQAFREGMKTERAPAGSSAARTAMSAAEPDLMAQLGASVENAGALKAAGPAGRQAAMAGLREQGMLPKLGGAAAFAPQAVEMLMRQFAPGFNEMKAEQQLVQEAQDFYGPEAWNAARTPEAQRALILEYARQHRPELTVRSYSQGI